MRMRAMAAASLAAAAILPGSHPAAAIFLNDRGNGVAELRGRFNQGDEKVFAEFLARPRARKIRVLWLDSHGGVVTAGIEIGKAVRRARIATAVDAQRAACDSACTLVFVAGVRRHYAGGQNVFEGHSSLSGLGFHGSSIRGNARRLTMKSDRGTQRMRVFYHAMGTPGANDLMQRAAINTLFRPSGMTALRLRIATSLAAP